jgi:hypothetical protein
MSSGGKTKSVTRFFSHNRLQAIPVGSGFKVATRFSLVAAIAQWAPDIFGRRKMVNKKVDL